MTSVSNTSFRWAAICLAWRMARSMLWSFDVFVHVSPRDQADYLQEIARVLAPGGTAVVHHSDGRNRGRFPSRHGWRSPMSRGLFAVLAAERGLKVGCQLDSWGPAGRYDLSGYGTPSLCANVKRRRADARRAAEGIRRPYGSTRDPAGCGRRRAQDSSIPHIQVFGR